jgi:CheY-like chemotaxis protein
MPDRRCRAVSLDSSELKSLRCEVELERVRLRPVGELDDGPVPAVDAQPQLRRIGSVRLLVVDDKDVFRSQLRAVLEPEGFEVAEACSGEAALACLARFRPDVVLMDVKMPGMSGIEATRSLLRLAPQTAVIMLSLFDDEDMVEMAVAAGVAAYLVKDARLDEILSAIRAAARERSRSFGDREISGDGPRTGRPGNPRAPTATEDHGAGGQAVPAQNTGT